MVDVVVWEKGGRRTWNTFGGGKVEVKRWRAVLVFKIALCELLLTRYKTFRGALL